nr:hypothetical protein [Tanacetum cinerariifolium]
MKEAQIVEEEDKESVAESHKHTIRKLKPREPYNQVYQERIMISGDYLVLGTENSFWDDFLYVNSTISKHMSPSKHLLYKMKESYGKISQAGEWMEITMYYGFPDYCDEDLKKTFEDYLLLPHTYYEFAKGRMPNKYTEGMGTFKDQSKGFADHFSTTVACMDVVNKHVSYNKAIKKIKKEDDNFVII